MESDLCQDWNAGNVFGGMLSQNSVKTGVLEMYLEIE